MVGFFQRYSLLRLFFVFIILLGIRIVASYLGLFQLIPEIKWLLVAERMADGNQLYHNINTTLEPLSALVYYFIHLIFDRSSTVYFYLSTSLIFFQAFMLNVSLNKNKVFRDPTAYPALFYILFASIYFDMFTLSPMLLANTFVIIAFDHISLQIRSEKGDSIFFYIGMYIGITTLFYLPTIILLPTAIFIFIVYSNIDVKKLIVMLVAFTLPYIILFIYYFWTDNIFNYLTNVIVPFFSFKTIYYQDFITIIKVSLLPSLLLFFAVPVVLLNLKLIHFQLKIFQASIWWFIAGFVILFLSKEFYTGAFIILAPALSMLISHFFISIYKNKIIANFLFIGIFGGMIYINLWAIKHPDTYSQEHLLVQEHPDFKKYNIINKKVFVIGEDFNYYYRNQIATPYINWKLKSYIFDDLDTYAYAGYVFDVFKKSNPDIIVDQKGYMPIIFKKIPFVAQNYQQIDNSIYYIKKKK